MSALWVDTDFAPIVLTVFNGRQTSDDMERYITTIESVYARRQPIVMVSYMLEFVPEATQLRRMGRFMRESRDHAAKYCLCNAIVAPAPGFRFVLSSVMVLHPMAMPYKVVDTAGAAFSWLEETLSEGPVELPEGTLSYLQEQMARARLLGP